MKLNFILKFKSVLKVALLLGLTFTITNCSKDDDPVYSEEGFYASFLTATGFDASVVSHVNSGSYEFGLEFAPVVKGKITALNVKLPDVNNALRVTIWDKATATPIRTETINVATANTEFTFDISDLELTKDHEYAITMNSDDWYTRRRTGSTAATYPIMAGNIKVINYKWISGTSQTYPANIDLTYYAGDLTFNFQQIK